MAKEVSKVMKLQVRGGQANPSPPVGPALGAAGVNIMEFCKQFNARSQEKMGQILPVVITVYTDKSFDFIVKTPPAAVQLMEAAKMESKSKWGLFANIIFPMLTPTIVIVLLLRLAEAIKLFDIPFALTGGGPGVATQSMSFLAFRTGLRYFDLGYASAMSYCLLIIVMIIVTLFFRKLRQSYA